MVRERTKKLKEHKNKLTKTKYRSVKFYSFSHRSKGTWNTSKEEEIAEALTMGKCKYEDRTL